MDRTYTVYMHTSPSGKRYIGITRQENVEDRWRNGLGYVNNTYFIRAIKKYGWNEFIHEILATNLTKEEAEQMEINLIAEYKSNNPDFGYNISNGGESKGKHSEKSKKKMSISVKKSFEDGRRQKILSKIQKEKLKNKENHPMWGKHHSEETKEKIRMANMGKVHSKEFKEKISKVTIGGNNPRAKRVFCDEKIFLCIKDCAEFYDVKRQTMSTWLNGTRTMPQKFRDLGLRWATEEDINTYPIYNKNIKQGE